MEHNKKRISPALISDLSELEQKVVRRVLRREHVSRNTTQEFEAQMTLGDRLADKVAAFGGSWTFVTLFMIIILGWVFLNSFLLVRIGQPYDPYPYILLNLFLSTLAAIQAPVILMAQNRQAEIDRLQATHDYEVNLKAELEIMLLHNKIDELKTQQLEKLAEMQQVQLELCQEIQKLVHPNHGESEAE